MTNWNGTERDSASAGLKNISAPLLIMRTVEGEVVKVNDRACEVLRTRPEQFIGRFWQEFISPESKMAMTEKMGRLISTGTPQRLNATWTNFEGETFRSSHFYSLMAAKERASFIMCESYVIADEKPKIEPVNIDDELKFIAENLVMISALAERSGLDVLDYSVKMALAEAKKASKASKRV